MLEDNRSPLEHPLHLKTPLLWSPELSEKSGLNIWLKLENTQSTASYKIRGIGHMLQNAVKNGCKHIISSSGGNAGMASAYAAKIMGVPCTVIVPVTTAPFMIEKIKHIATNVEVFGQSWDEANGRAMEMAKQPGTFLAHPFDHPDIWEGHSTMIDEIIQQLHGRTLDVIVVSVGGGGLLCGLLKGLHKHNLQHVPVVTMETVGAMSFNICVKSGKHIGLDKVDTIAKTLAVKKIAQRTFEWIGQHKPIISRLCTDKEAVKACMDFAEDHRFLVSPACGAALNPIYDGTLTKLQKEGLLPEGKLNVAVVVCGGNEVDLVEVARWKQLFGFA